MIGLLLLLGITVGVVALAVQDVLRERWAPRLEPGCAPAAQPLVSVIIPARNEAARIGDCLAGLAAQRYRAFETVVVDDHSTDGTAEVVQSYAYRLPALTLARGATLPPGWAGKCWACQQAAGRARGAWLLFLDADVVPQPDLIQALVARATQRPVTLITLMPLLHLGTLAERLVLPAFQTMLYGLYPLHRVSNPASPVAFANGQCIFIRRDVYERLGGHRLVQGEVLEDAIFGQRVKAAGELIEAATARDLLHVRMYTDWPSLAEGLRKHAVAGARNGGLRAAWVGMRQALLAFAPLYLLGSGLALWAAQRTALAVWLLLHGALLAVVCYGVAGWLWQRRYRIGPWWGLLYPLGLALYYGLAGAAFVRAWRGQGVVWKGRTLRG